MNSKQHSRPLWVGFISSALFAPSSVGVIATPIYGLDLGYLIFLVGLGFTILSTLFITAPLIYTLRKKGELRSTILYLGGFFVGAVTLGLAAFIVNYSPHIEREGYLTSMVFNRVIPTILPGGILGLLSAIAFCVGAGVALNPLQTEFTRAHSA